MGVSGNWRCSSFREQKTESTGNLHRWRIFSSYGSTKRVCASDVVFPLGAFVWLGNKVGRYKPETSARRGVSCPKNPKIKQNCGSVKQIILYKVWKINLKWSFSGLWPHGHADLWVFCGVVWRVCCMQVSRLTQLLTSVCCLGCGNVNLCLLHDMLEGATI